MFDLKKEFVHLNNQEDIAYLKIGDGKKIIMFIHGNYSSSCHFLPLFKIMPKDYTIIAPDLRGYGDSSYKNRFDTLDELALDIIELCDILKIKNIPVLGWSLGGGVAMKIAAKRPDIVSKLILVEGASHKGYPVFKKDSTYHNIFGKVYDTKEEMALDPVLVVPALNAFKTKNLGFFETIYTATMWNISKPDNREELNLYLSETAKERCLVDADWALCNLNMSGVSNGYNNGTQDIDKISCPTLLTWAKKDLVVFEHMVRDNLEAIKGSKLAVYEDVGHSVITDIPDQLLKDILEFVNS